VSKRPVSRPTEGRAVGRTGQHRILNLRHLLHARGEARTRRDLHGVHLLGGHIQRALDPKAGE
jgi:hypothetical protein